MPRLELLNVRNNELSKASCEALAKVIHAGGLPQLQVLNICNNDLSKADILALTNVIAANAPNLELLA